MPRSVLLAAVLLAPVCAHAQTGRVRVDRVGSAPRQMSSGPTAWAGTSGWRLVLERTIQPAEETPGMLGSPTEVVLFRDGRVAVAEDPRGRGKVGILLFDAQGNFVRRLGRDGEGPGEYRSVAVAGYGDTLVIQDQRLARITLLGVDGKLIRSFPSRCCASGVPVGVSEQGMITVSYGSGWWARFTAGGKLVDTLSPPEAAPVKEWTPPPPMGGRYSIPFTAYTGRLLLRDGTILYGVQDRQEFVVSRGGKDSVRIFGRASVVARPVPDSARRTLIAQLKAHPALGPVFKEDDIPTTLPVWQRLFEDERSNLWVLDGYFTMAPARGFDVFAKDGRYLGAVATPSATPISLSFNNGRVAILDLDGDDLPRVRIFRVDRNGK